MRKQKEIFIIAVITILLSSLVSAQNSDFWDLIHKGQRLKVQGKYSEAIRIFEKAINVAQDKFGYYHENTARALSNLSVTYQTMKMYKEAYEIEKQILDVHKEIKGERSNQVANDLRTIANLYKKAKMYEEAEDFYKKAIDIKEEIFGSGTTTYNIEADLANLYIKQNKYSQADNLYKRMQKKEKESAPCKPKFLAHILELREKLYRLIKQYDKANEFSNRARQIRQKNSCW